MKKLLALLIILGTVNIAGAAVLKVVPVDVGLSEGRLGSQQDVLLPSDVIGLAIVLENNPFYIGEVAYPEYNGYYLSSMDVDLEVSGAATLLVGEDMFGNPLLGVNAGLSPFTWTGIAGNAIAKMSGVALTPIGPGEQDIIWDLLLHCDGLGVFVIDLTLNGLSEYAEYEKTASGGSWVWAAMTEGDLGDLVIYTGIPEPMTIALLGLGGLFLLRRRK